MLTTIILHIINIINILLFLLLFLISIVLHMLHMLYFLGTSMNANMLFYLLQLTFNPFYLLYKYVLKLYIIEASHYFINFLFHFRYFSSNWILSLTPLWNWCIWVWSHDWLTACFFHLLILHLLSILIFLRKFSLCWLM